MCTERMVISFPRNSLLLDLLNLLCWSLLVAVFEFVWTAHVLTLQDDCFFINLLFYQLGCKLGIYRLNKLSAELVDVSKQVSRADELDCFEAEEEVGVEPIDLERFW